ncbi:hypothetical protein FIU83_10540 [Halomonas sp. THAF5a]|uniref:hypothetical protein n=1 Tax=Halomonas sp. THAF5a TaxID=2587844 RepID=UPI0012692233|nr:hypothetical protein [Halomonas sp. THAF5a]QFU02079.1 hypothetical protein FIU83_10540 [Halomonas sp. THAF5a]
MSSDPLFRATLEHLLQGGVVCSVATPEIYHYLSSSGTQERVRGYLNPLGRGLAQTRDMVSFYAVYLDTEDASTRHILRHQFADLTNSWEAMIRWLRMSRSTSEQHHPIMAMDVVSESEWLKAIESSSALQEELEVIATKFGLRGKVRDPRQRLRHLLEKLHKMGYLEPLGTSGAMYRATGKWSLLRDLMEWVRQQEGLAEAEREDEEAMSQEQEDMFHGTP